jgi:hypothetical protein
VTVRFDDAWRAARTLAEEVSDSGLDAVLVRDLLGRITLVLADEGDDRARRSADAFAKKLAAEAGRFAADPPLQLKSALFSPEDVFESPQLVPIRVRSGGRGSLAIIERGVIGGDWSRLEENPHPNWIALYSFKGGVGRSTAAFMLAQHLAMQGRCVLVADLDLESPGVSGLLLTADELPDHGLVDHLIEAAAGNEQGLELVRRSPFPRSMGNGEVWLAPGGGRPRDGYDYLAKLNRVYTDLPAGLDDGTARPFAHRLTSAIGAAEAQVAELSREPDFVLLDSRAGIHDIAAVAIGHCGLSFLFAVDNGYTWAGYSMLFNQWRIDPKRPAIIRDRLKMVAALVPDNAREAYLATFRDHSQQCFAETLYDDVPGGELADGEVYNPAPADPDAPHYPLPILFEAGLVGVDPTRRRDWSEWGFVATAFQAFVEGASDLIGEGDL